jgi:C-terminal processing protease CtpA/Prc
VVFSIPSHDPQYVRVLDSLVAVHDTSIRSRPLLIVDLRGNEGGAAFTSRALNPYVTSTDRVPTPFDSGTAVMLSSPSNVRYARRFTGTDTSAFVRSLVARMEAQPGQLIPLEEGPSDASPRDVHFTGNWRVVVLVDQGTVSAAEVFVLRALRSQRATVVGVPTAGALDYQSVQIISLGTGDARWALGYPTIAAHADLPRRGMRGRGIQPQVRLDWAAIGDVILQIEQMFLP